jgi:hypothetical protein
LQQLLAIAEVVVKAATGDTQARRQPLDADAPYPFLEELPDDRIDPILPRQARFRSRVFARGEDKTRPSACDARFADQ